MKNKIYIAIICAFSIVFAVSSGFLIKHYCDSAKQAEMYDNLIEVVETEPEETKEPMNYSEEKTFIPEYQELYLQNNDMVGWIKVEDTKINYPVMQSKDNPNFYLKHGFDKAYRNNDKYEKRAKRTIDVYGYEDDISEQFHRELITPFVDPFEQAEEERIEEEKEQLRQLEIAKVRKVLEMLKPVQRERLIKAILLGMSSRKIAKEEGVYYSVVDKSIAAARKNFKKFYENL